MSRKLRVLHIGNGRAFKIKAIVDGLIARGHDIHMVPIPPAQNDFFTGVTWHRLPSSRAPGQAKVLHNMLQLRRLAQRLRPDVVHAHNAWGPGWFAAAAGRHPFLIHGYGSDLLPYQYAGRPRLQRWATSWACRSADQIIVTGEHMVGASAALGIDREKVTVLPRGVDTRRYRPGLDTTSLRRELGLDGLSPIILSPRYQISESLYNCDIVVEAVAKLRTRFPQIACIQMHQSDSEAAREKLRQKAIESGLADRYKLVPSVDNETMPLYYNLADVTVSVPSSDGFPVTVLEASACGSPLVVSELAYCGEWFVSRENGLLVPPRDAQALAEAVAELCSNRDVARRIATAGRRLVEAKADYERCMDRLEALYFALLDKRSAEPRQEAN